VLVSSISSRSARDTASCREGFREKRNEREKDTYKISNTSHLHLLARAGAVPDEGDQDGDAGIEHAGCLLVHEAVRNREDQLLVGDDAGGVPVLGAGAIRALAGLRTNRRIVSISRCDQGSRWVYAHICTPHLHVDSRCRLYTTDTCSSSRSTRPRLRNRLPAPSFHTSGVVLMVSWAMRFEVGMAHMHIRTADAGLGS
jgi:hypothetical protein